MPIRRCSILFLEAGQQVDFDLQTRAEGGNGLREHLGWRRGPLIWTHRFRWTMHSASCWDVPVPPDGVILQLSA